MRIRTKFALGIITLVLVFGVIQVANLSNNQTSHAKQQENTMGNLLLRLWTQTLNQQIDNKTSNFNFWIELTTPVSIFENQIALGSNLELTRIEEIGADYVCASRTWADGRRVVCTPFSNISNVFYQQ